MFSKYNFKDYINEGLKNIGFIKPTEIQEEVIPLVLDGKNIVGKSQTGTGKTHAFILPILQKLDEDKKDTQAVIVVPTRELGKQIYDEFIKITLRCYFDGALLKTDTQAFISKETIKSTDLAGIDLDVCFEVSNGEESN